MLKSALLRPFKPTALHLVPAAAPALEDGLDTRPLAQDTEWLPFEVEVVRNKVQLAAAVHIRQAAYARHLPAFSRTLGEPEADDHRPGSTVLLARSKLDGSPIGTMRIQTNRHQALPLEQSVELPDEFQGCVLAEATRLGITQQPIGRLVKTALFKAFYQLCQRDGVDHMVVAGRAPIDRQYERLLFEDVFPGRGAVPLRHAAMVPHRILSLNVETAQARWREAGHPLLGFMCATHHPDLHLAPTETAVHRAIPRTQGVAGQLHRLISRLNGSGSQPRVLS